LTSFHAVVVAAAGKRRVRLWDKFLIVLEFWRDWPAEAAPLAIGFLASALLASALLASAEHALTIARGAL
jgi:hypothetical protein